MQIYIMPDGSKRQFEVAPEGARPLKPEKKVEKVEEKPNSLQRTRPLRRRRTKQLPRVRLRGPKQNEQY